MLNNSSFLISNIRKNKQKYIKINNKKNNIKINKKNTKPYKVGFVITTHKNNTPLIKSCLESILKYAPKNSYFIVYANESNEPFVLNIPNNYPGVDCVYIKDQKKNHGLTGTWNQGIIQCFKKKCDTVVLCNHDLTVNESLSYILDEAKNCPKNKLEYYGPRTSENHLKELKQNKKNEKKILSKMGPCGFFLVIPKHVLIKNKLNDKEYFNNKFPFRGNENEWHTRLLNKKGNAYIITDTFVPHLHIGSWRETKKIYKTSVKKIVVSAIFSLDEKPIDLPKVEKKIPGWKYILYTNCKSIKNINSGWEIKIVELINNHPIFTARYYKWLGHKYLQDYDIMLWVDGYLSPNINFNWETISNIFYVYKFNGIFLKKHPIRKCIYDEILTCLKLRKDNLNNLNKTLKLCVNNTMPINYGLYETGIFMRDLKNDKLNFFLETFYDLLLQHSYRDQTMLTYVLWKYEYKNIKLLNDFGDNFYVKSGKMVRVHKYVK